MFGVKFFELLGAGEQLEFDALNKSLRGYMLVEHKDDGTHSAVTADSVTTPSLVGPCAVSGRTTLENLAISASAVFTPSQITANQNDYNPFVSGKAALEHALVLRISSDAARTITGFAAPSTAQPLLLLVNTGEFTISLSHQSSSSSADNRIDCPGAANFSLTQKKCAWIWYDQESDNWRVIG